MRWGRDEGFVSAVLLVSGGLWAPQAASIIAALPVSVIMPFMGCELIRRFIEERAIVAPPSGPRPERPPCP